MEAEEMVPRGCCAASGESGSQVPSAKLSRRLRIARLLAGVGFLTLPLLLPAGAWPISAVAAWFGLSHLTAAATGYGGCPELGAIPSAVLRRQVTTRCGPWEWLDRRIEREVR